LESRENELQFERSQAVCSSGHFVRFNGIRKQLFSLFSILKFIPGRRMTIKKYSNVTVALFIFCVIVVFYSPIFFYKFGYHNDYLIWDYNVRACCLGHPETEHLIGVGRPILAVLFNIHQMFISDMQSLQFMHVVAVLSIGLIAALFFLHIQNILYINRFNAALLSVLTFTLPSMAINSFWVANFASEILPLFIVLFAHYLMSKQNKNSILNSVFIFSLLFISLLIYPPATLFFVTLTFIKFLFGDKNPDRDKLSALFTETLILLSACAVYFLSFKYFYKSFLLKTNLGGFDFQVYYKFIESNRSEYSFSLFSDLTQKIGQCQELLTLIFSAWFPPLAGYIVSPLVLGFILILSIATLSNPYLKNFQMAGRVSIGLAIFISLALLTALPILAASAKFEINYRAIFASMAIIPAIIVYVLDRTLLMAKKRAVVWISSLVTLSLLIIAGEIASIYRLVLVAERSATEYNNVRNVVSNSVFEEQKIIMFPYASATDSLDSYKNFLYSDFGLIAPLGMAPTASGMSPAGIFKAAAQDIGLNLDDYSIVLGPRYNADISNGITFNREGYPSFITYYKGISGQETWGRWTDGEEAIIGFSQSLPKNFTLKITAGTSALLKDKTFKIMIGNTQLETKFSKLESTEVALNVSTDGNAKSIIFKFQNIKSPKELGLSTDPRHLGLGLIKLQIIP
jgi:hypothetical protein